MSLMVAALFQAPLVVAAQPPAASKSAGKLNLRYKEEPSA